MKITPGANANGRLLFIVDSAATVSCVNDHSLIRSSTYTCLLDPREANIEGINSGANLQVNGAGLLFHPFEHTRALHALQASENILSWWDIKRTFLIQLKNQDATNEHLELTSKQLPRTIIRCFIDPHLGLYVFIPDRRVPSHLDFHDVPRRILRMSTTLQLQYKGYTKDHANRIARVQALHESMGFAGPEAIGRIIQRRGIGGTITYKDYVNWKEDYHPKFCTGCPHGKSKSANASTSTSRGSDSIGELCFTDLFYFSSRLLPDSLKIALAIDDVSSMFHAQIVASKTKADLTKAYEEIKKSYKDNGHDLKVIRSDNEPAYTNLSSRLQDNMDISLTHSEDYRHNKRAERGIRTVRERVLSILHGSETPIPTFLYPYLIQFAVQCINNTFSSHNDALTPSELFYKEKKTIDIDQILRVKFGQLVRYFNSKYPAGKSDESKASYGIILGIDPLRPHCAIIFNFIENVKDSRAEYFPMEWPTDLKKLYLSKFTEFIAAENPVFLDAQLQPILDDLSPMDLDPTPDNSRTTTAEPVNLSMDLESPTIPTSATHIDSQATTTAETQDDLEKNILDIIRTSPPSSPEKKPITYIRSKDGLSYNRLNPTPAKGRHKSSRHHNSTGPNSKNNSDTEDSIHSHDSDNNDMDESTDGIAGPSLPTDDCDEGTWDQLLSSNSPEQFNVNSSQADIITAFDSLLLNVSPASTSSPSTSTTTTQANPFESIGSRIRHQSRNKRYHGKSIRILNLSIKKALLEYSKEKVHEAVHKEFNNISSHDTWDFQTPAAMSQSWSEGIVKNIIPCSLFLKFKEALDILKARLIVHGDKQILNNLFGSNSSPTININILFLIISICSKMGYDFESIDIAGAYLNVDLPEPEFMRIPKDLADILVANDPTLEQYREKHGHHIGSITVKLKKALYGLKSSGKLWYQELNQTLLDLGFTRSSLDKCLYFRKDGLKVTYALVYVDDIFLAGNDPVFRASVIEGIKSKFGKISRQPLNDVLYLGMQIQKQQNGDICVSQSTLIDNILADYEISKSSPSPCSKDIFNEHRISNPALADVSEYLSLNMQLLYVASRTRPDILLPTVVYASRSKSPTIVDYDRLIKVCQYLHGTRHHHLLFVKKGPISPRVFVDSSFNIHWDAKGHTGFVIYPDKGHSAGILFKSLKHKTTSNSSTEAELMALHEAMLHICWIADVYLELGFDVKPIDVYQDNLSAITLSSEESLNFHGRSKFINRKYFGIFEKIEDGTIQPVHVGTEDMIADILTKALVGKKFKNFTIALLGYKSIT